MCFTCNLGLKIKNTATKSRENLIKFVENYKKNCVYNITHFYGEKKFYDLIPLERLTFDIILSNKINNLFLRLAAISVKDKKRLLQKNSRT